MSDHDDEIYTRRARRSRRAHYKGGGGPLFTLAIYIYIHTASARPDRYWAAAAARRLIVLISFRQTTHGAPSAACRGDPFALSLLSSLTIKIDRIFSFALVRDRKANLCGTSNTFIKSSAVCRRVQIFLNNNFFLSSRLIIIYLQKK